MVRLRANFLADLVAHARRYMREDWAAIPSAVDPNGSGRVAACCREALERIDERNLLIYFFDAQRRRIDPHPRDLHIADDFTCSPDFDDGWQILQRKVGQGEDLEPHLSTSHACLFNRDGLLNEWGVHHFHLGTKPHPTKRYWVERAGPVVFALVDVRAFYAINVYNHGEWEETSVVESLHRNWPDVINGYRVMSIPGEPLDKKQRRNLRTWNGHAAVATSDGTVYGAIGTGVSSAGTAMASVMRSDICASEITRFQSAVEADQDKFLPDFERLGYVVGPEVEATLHVMRDGYGAFFPSYGVLARVIGAAWSLTVLPGPQGS